MKTLEAVAKLLCQEKSMIFRPFESGSQAATTHPPQSTPSGSIEEDGPKGPGKSDFNGQMSFATASNKFVHLSVFDLDRTLITSNCSLDFCRYLIAKKVLPLTTLLHSTLYYLRYLFFNLSPEELHAHVFERFLKGRTLESLEIHVDAFIAHSLNTSLYAPAVQRLKLAQQLGHYTVILSNSPSFLVKKIANALGVSNWKATEYAVDKEQKLCHISTIMQGEEKASYVLDIVGALGMTREDVTAYSDSIWDLPLLLAAGNAVVVHPDRKLRAYSRERKWAKL